jgi:hypothetical protein
MASFKTLVYACRYHKINVMHVYGLGNTYHLNVNDIREFTIHVIVWKTPPTSMYMWIYNIKH